MHLSPAPPALHLWWAARTQAIASPAVAREAHERGIAPPRPRAHPTLPAYHKLRQRIDNLERETEMATVRGGNFAVEHESQLSAYRAAVLILFALDPTLLKAVEALTRQAFSQTRPPRPLTG